jgi:UDP-N-acetylglucosamine--N-acetylmuramyl-(pentapeptide) pyrophosphoryl-undecaprenol N-acetylglucosamine transferase
MKLTKIIISGGGTGGHIFPALAIADEIKRRNEAADILFIGAEGKMEMEKVPQAGYPIVGLPIVGFQRKLTLKNLLLPIKLLQSLLKAFVVIRRFKPELVIGVGGYASGPTLQMAQLLGVPTLLQEQNSFPGKTNQLLARKAKAICVAYPEMAKFFEASKIQLTGNPVRAALLQNLDAKSKKQPNFLVWRPVSPLCLSWEGASEPEPLTTRCVPHFPFLRNPMYRSFGNAANRLNKNC